MKPSFLFFLLIFAALGCSKAPEGFEKFSIDAPARNFRYYAEAGKAAYLKGGGMRKTFFEIVDLRAHKKQALHIENYIIGNAAELLAGGQALLSTNYTTPQIRQAHVLRINCANRKKTGDYLFPDEAPVQLIRQSEGGGKVYILMQTQKSPEQIYMKTFDPQTQNFSDSEMLVSASLSRTLFLKSRPLLVLDAAKMKTYTLLIYDLEKRAHVFDLETSSPSRALIETKDGRIFGLFESPGDTKSKLMELDLEKKELRLTAALDGTGETLLAVDRSFYIAVKDTERASEQKKYWLHPRNLMKVNIDTGMQDGKIDWTERAGEFVGFNEETRQIYFAVTDADAPALWTIDASPETLARVKDVIK